MKKHDFFISLLVLFGLVFCCRQMTAELKAGVRIPVAEALKKNVRLKASDYFQSIEYIPLELTDKCPVAANSKIRLFGDKILIFNAVHKQCFLFDRATGRFLCSVGHIGHDPEGVENLFPHLNYDNNTITFAGWKDVLQVYSNEGKYLRKIRIPDYDFYRPETEFLFMAEGAIAQYFSRFGQSREYLKLFTAGKTLQVIDRTPGESSVHSLKDIQLVNIVSGNYSGEEDKDYGVRYFTPRNVNTATLIYYKNGQASISIADSHLWRTGNSYYFREDYNDTIFQIKDKRILPAYILDMGSQHWDASERFKLKKDHSLLITKVLDGKNFLLISCVTRPYDYSGFKSYNVVWDKKSETAVSAPLAAGITNDIYPFMNLQLLSASPDGDFADLIPADEVVEWLDKNGSSALPPALKALRDLKEDDNPVVVIMKSK